MRDTLLNTHKLRQFLQNAPGSIDTHAAQMLLRQPGMTVTGLWPYLEDAARVAMVRENPMAPLGAIQPAQWPEYLRLLRRTWGHARPPLSREPTAVEIWVAWLTEGAPTALPAVLDRAELAYLLVTNPPTPESPHWQIDNLVGLAAHILSTHIDAWPETAAEADLPITDRKPLEDRPWLRDSMANSLIPALPAQGILTVLQSQDLDLQALDPDAQVALLENPATPWVDFLPPVLINFCGFLDQAHDAASVEAEFQRLAELMSQLPQRWPAGRQRPTLNAFSRVLQNAYGDTAWVEPAVVKTLVAWSAWPQSYKLPWLKLISASPAAMQDLLREDPDLFQELPDITLCNKPAILRGFSTAALCQRLQLVLPDLEHFPREFTALLAELESRPGTPWDQLSAGVLAAMMNIPMAQQLGGLFPGKGFPGVLPDYAARVRDGMAPAAAWASASHGPQGLQAWNLVRAIDLPPADQSEMLQSLLQTAPYLGVTAQYPQPELR